MTMCRMTVQTAEGVWQDDVDCWTGLVILAALSAEPESFDELAEAVRRYQPGHELFAPPWDRGVEVVVTDGPWCLVELTGRTVVAGNGFELPDPQGAYEADEDEQVNGFPIVWLDTPADWLFSQANDWRGLVAARASARTAIRRVDARAVLFGGPMLEFLAENVIAAVAQGSLDEQRQREHTRSIHAGWLLTARADLDGHTPRELLLAERNRISRDLEHRSQQWSRQRRPAPPLPPDSLAYRLGGFGTVEVVLYFDLMRALLGEAWELTRQQPRLTQAELIERLADYRDNWLEEPTESSGPFLTAAELIESERRRMPVTSDGSHLDCDCPLCQALAEGEFGPAFMCFDGHHLELEDEFAFSLCVTREEWEREQEDYRCFAEKVDLKNHEKSADTSVWQRTFVNWDVFTDPDASPQMVALAFGFPLAELISDLQDRPNGGDLVEPLNRVYGTWRTSQDAVVVDSIAQELGELLEAVSEKFPDLTPKCADLQGRLDEVLRRLA